MTDRIERIVFNSLLSQTNDKQGEWISEQSLFTVTCANGGLTHPAVEEALGKLEEEQVITRDEDDRLKPARTTRIPHPGEV